MSVRRASVSHTGRRFFLAALVVWILLGAACSASAATIHGTFQGVGGPHGAGPYPYAGTVHLTGSSGRYTVSVSSSGRFTVQIAPGTYRVWGTSPQYNGGKMRCDGQSVVVKAGEPTDAVVDCQLH